MKKPRQVIQENYYENVTLSGTIGQVLTGLFDIDLPGDIRDVSYNITHWEWSKEHGIQFTLDMVGILPLIGVLKYGDEAKALVKAAYNRILDWFNSIVPVFESIN